MIPNHSSPISAHIHVQSLKKKGRKLLNMVHWNQFSTQIKGNNSEFTWQNLPIYNPKPLFPNINSKTKFEENLSKNAQDKERKQSGDYGRTFVPTDGHLT